MPAFLDTMIFQQRRVHGLIILQGSESSNVFFSDELAFNDPNVLQGEFSPFGDTLLGLAQGIMAGKQGFEQVDIPGTTTIIHGKYFSDALTENVVNGYHVYIYLELETA